MRILFILFSLFLASTSALASVTLYAVGGYEAKYGYFQSRAELCSHYPAPAGQSQGGWGGGSNGTQAYCISKDSSGNLWVNGYINSYTYPDCPSGQSYKGGSNVCTPDGPQCVTPAGSTVTWTQLEGHQANPNATTSGNKSVPSSSPTCALSDVPDVKECFTRPASDGGKDFYCTWSGISNGSNAPAGSAPTDTGAKPTDATPTNTTKTADSNGKCPGGTVQAGVDSSGIPICVGSGSNPNQSSSSSVSTSPPTTTTAADGTKTTTSSQSTTNSDGSVTVKTTTTVTSPDGSVKTTTSTTTGNNPSGGGGKDDSTKDFCSQHPELTICRNSSISGSCGQIACDGDAIQCATLRAAAAMQCAQQQDIDALKAMPQKALGDQIMAGADPMAGQISDTLKGTDVDMSRVSFDQSGFLAGGMCLANRSFVVLGQTVPVDFTSVCNNIAPLRAVMMAVALIMAYLIVGRSVVGS